MYQYISGQENHQRFNKLVREMSQKKTENIIKNVLKVNEKAKVRFQEKAQNYLSADKIVEGNIQKRRGGLMALLPDIK